MSKYELVLVLDPEEKESDMVVKKVKGWIEAAKGKVEKEDNWGTKDFSYKIKKLTQGRYEYFLFSLGADQTGAFERRLRIEPEIIRYLMVKP